MIQRIQTVYLLIVVALMVATLFLPLAVLQSGGELFRFDATGLSTMAVEPELIYPTWGLFGLVAIIALVAFGAIFMFKKRVLQIRMCIFNAILKIGFYGLFLYFVLNLKGDMEGASMTIKFALSFPLISIILDYLAIRNIGADETLVRSLERLR